MKKQTIIKSTVSFLALAVTLLTHGQAIDVRLSPDVQALAIGQLESSGLAVDAQWPEGQDPVEGWKPIFYRGIFEVFVNNNDISKDLTPKPGSSYFLSPDKGATVLSTATKDDRTDLISVDPRYSKLNVETILVAYIKDIAAVIEELPSPQTTAASPASETTAQDAPSPTTAPEAPSELETTTEQAVAEVAEVVEEEISTVQTVAENPVRRLQGRLQTTNLVEKGKTSCPYKLIGPNGKTLAFLDTEILPEFIIIKDYIGNNISVTGRIVTIEPSNNLKIIANSLKKAN